MNAIFLTKKEKPKVQDAIEIANRYFDNLTVCYGEIKDELPQEIKKRKYDIIISYISPWIIPKKILEETKKWNINFHPGPPEFPGIGCFNFAIYKSVEKFGATAHIMNERVDTGNIIGVKRFIMDEMETVESLSNKTYVCMFELYKIIMQHIIEYNSLPICSETWKRVPYKRSELENLSKLSHSISENEINKRIRATYFPGKPAPFIEIFGYKFEYNPDR